MPALPDVTQTFEADVGPYIAALKEAAQAARDFAAANALAAGSMVQVGGTAKIASNGVDEMARAAEYLMIMSGQLEGVETTLAQSLVQLGIIAKNTADSSLDLMMANQILSESFDRLNGQLTGTLARLAALRVAQESTGTGGANALNMWLGGWRLTGAAIHWIISGTAELLAVVLPAALAAGAAALVMYQGVVEQVTRRMTSLVTATEATGAMLHQTTGDVLGLGHAFQAAQDKANPVAYELMGEYIGIAKQHMGGLATAGLQVAQVLGELGARMQGDLIANADRVNGLLSNMVTDLIGLGQVFGNLGHALLNFASDMPGLAEVLLQILNAITFIILKVSGLYPWVITLAMGFEELNRWGGLLMTMFGRMGLAAGTLEKGILNPMRAISIFRMALTILPTILGNVGLAMTLFAGKLPLVGGALEKAGAGLFKFGNGADAAIAGLGAGTVAVIAGLTLGVGFLIGELVRAQNAGEVFADTINKIVNASSNLNVLNTIATSVGRVNQQLSQTRTSAAYATEGWRGVGVAYSLAHGSAQALVDEQLKLTGQFANVVGGARAISNETGVNMAGALGLADQAGIKLANTTVIFGQHANTAGLQIEALVRGYKALDQSGTILTNDMNAVTVQAGLQGSKVNQLNSAWDTFLGNATGLTSSLATLNQDLTQVGNTGVQVGRRFTTFSGTAKISIDQVAQSLTKFTGTSAQTWQNYDAALQQAGQFTDQLRIATEYGGVAQRQYTGMIANTVAAILPFTSRSRTAVSELSVLAQEAGGPATDSFKVLKEWVDRNHISAKQFNEDVQNMTAQMSNAGKAAQQFAGALQQQLQQQMANALLASNNLNGAVQQFQNAVLKAGGQISSSSPQYKQLYNMLRAAGYNAAQARAELKLLQGTIDQMHGKNVPINVVTTYTSQGNPNAGGGGTTGGGMPRVPGFHGGVVGYAAGGMVGGPGGVDRVPAWLTMGEGVLTSRAVAALGGPLAIRALNQSSQATLRSMGAGGSVQHLTVHVDSYLDGKMVATGQRTQTLVYNRRNPDNNLRLRIR